MEWTNEKVIDITLCGASGVVLIKSSQLIVSALFLYNPLILHM